MYFGARFAFLLIASVIFCGTVFASTENEKPRVIVSSYYGVMRLHVTSQDRDNQLVGAAQITIRAEQDEVNSLSFFLNPGLRIESVKMQGAALNHSVEEKILDAQADLRANQVIVALPEALDKYARRDIQISFRGRPRAIFGLDSGRRLSPAENLKASGFTLGHEGLSWPILAEGFEDARSIDTGWGRPYPQNFTITVQDNFAFQAGDQYYTENTDLSGGLKKFEINQQDAMNRISLVFTP